MQLLEEKENSRVRRPHGMKHITAEEDQVGALRQQVVHRAAERLRDVGLALIPPPWRLPVVLAEAEVQVGEVRELHRVTWPRRAGARSAASAPSSSRPHWSSSSRPYSSARWRCGP